MFVFFPLSIPEEQLIYWVNSCMIKCKMKPSFWHVLALQWPCAQIFETIVLFGYSTKWPFPGDWCWNCFASWLKIFVANVSCLFSANYRGMSNRGIAQLCIRFLHSRNVGRAKWWGGILHVFGISVQSYVKHTKYFRLLLTAPGRSIDLKFACSGE